MVNFEPLLYYSSMKKFIWKPITIMWIVNVRFTMKLLSKERFENKKIRAMHDEEKILPKTKSPQHLVRILKRFAERLQRHELSKT